MTTPVSDRIIGIAADVFGIPRTSITPDSAPGNVESWDSARHLTFILALEETFDLQLSPEETERIRTIGEAVRLLEEKLPPAKR